MTKLRALVISAPAFILMAAAPAPYSAQDPGFGATVDTLVAAQAVDMTPEYAGVPLEGGNGKRAADAYKRYQSGNVKKLLSVTGKSEVGSQGGANEQMVTTSQPNQ